MMLPGLRVVRGPDWCHGDGDGGIGYLGTVVKILSNNTVGVQWDIGTETVCRAGLHGAYDLRIYDNAQIGVKSVTCDGKCLDTEDSNIYGMRWKCLECYDRDNCTPCYMALDDVCMKHSFVRYNTQDSLVERVPPRHHSEKIRLYGIFPGAEVKKRESSKSASENGYVGIVKELIHLENNSYRSAVKVEWLKEASKPVSDLPLYRIGAEGKVELKLVSAVSPGTIYIEHLPVLDLTMPISRIFKEGDVVRMDQNLVTFQALMKEYGGWIPELEKVLGEEGTILSIKDESRHIVSVQYDNLGITVRAMYTNVLTKITTISAGDMVDIIKEEDTMKQLQQQHGGWEPCLKQILGSTGKVIRIVGTVEAIVEVNKETFLLNIECLTLCQTKMNLAGSLRKDRTLKLPAAARLQAFQGDWRYIGTRVVRGPDWSPDFEDQDGGEGHLGTVVEVYGLKTDDNHPQQCVTVQWDNGEKNVYRAGLENSFDVRIYDNASLGVKHNITCSECKVDVIYGMLWKCQESPDINLCSECYHNDAYDIDQKFIRFDDSDDTIGTEVPKRSISKKLSAHGIFEKCRVRRGPDWRWNEQDGGADKCGEVIAIVNFCPDTDRDAVEVTWENGYTNVYRLGYKGRLDVVCVDAVSGGHYYRDHIPILKLTGETTSDDKTEPVVNDNEEEVVDKEAARFEEGDKVRIEIDVDVLKMMEENRGTWNHQMVECIGHVGTVLVTKGNSITVDFHEAGRWTFHESVLNKVREFVPGETVKVKDNIDTVRMLQTERGGWNDLMRKVIGRNGSVECIDEDGDVQVCFGEYTWTLNPECLIPTLEKADIIKENDPEPVDAVAQKPHKIPTTPEEKLEELFEVILAGENDRVNGIIQRNPELTVMDFDGRFAVHCTAKCGQVEAMKILFSTASKETLLEMKDGQGMTPLLTAVEGNQADMVRYLVSEGAEKSACNTKQHSAVHIAVINNNVQMLHLLRQLGFDPNLKDELRQSPIFEAMAQDDENIIKTVLEWPNIDVQYKDSIGFSPFFMACRMGHKWAVEKILEIRPDEILERKEDGFTGLHLAAFNRNIDVLNFLLKQSRVQLDAETDKGMTSLHLACSVGSLDAIVILGDKGAKVTQKSKSKKNCLHLYFEGLTERTEDSIDNFKKIVEYLINHDTQVDERDETGKLPVDYIGDNKDLQTTYERIRDTILGKKSIVRSQHTDTGYNGQAAGVSNDVTTRNNNNNNNNMSDICGSCDEETVSVRLSPCGHCVCSDCAPRKKQKKKLCAVCGESCNELTELS